MNTRACLRLRSLSRTAMQRLEQVCTAEQLTEEIGAMIQGVVLTLPEGSLTQRVQVRAVVGMSEGIWMYGGTS